mmetsp:Transcript_18842/g.43317  ORF Transcript_18842/g.43317 Transcript_18842/m.43317 type:complete len:242 (-) Transcript_18842:170-895(-)
MRRGRQGYRTLIPSLSTFTQPSDTTERRMLDSSLSKRLMSSTYRTPLCALASRPGSNTVFPCLTDCSTSTEPSRRSSRTLSGTWTKGHSMTSDSKSFTVLPDAASSLERKSSTSPRSSLGSILNRDPLTISMGGRSLCRARAMTDFPVPRPPAMITPPICGFTAARSSAVLIGCCPTMRERGRLFIEVEDFRYPLVSISMAAAALASASALATMLRLPTWKPLLADLQLRDPLSGILVTEG